MDDSMYDTVEIDKKSNIESYLRNYNDTYNNPSFVADEEKNETINTTGEGEFSTKIIDLDLSGKDQSALKNEVASVATLGITSKDLKKKKYTIVKNILTLSTAFMFNFTAYQSMASLQSSINPDEGLGTASLAVLYGALVASCMFVPTWLIRTIKCKWTICLCMLTYSVYIGAQFYPVYGTLVPAAVIVGLGAAPMWSAKCTYLTQMGNLYALLNGEKSSEPIISRFFGIFFMIFQTASIWGNLISSFVLSTDQKAESTLNQTQVQQYCGRNFCPYTDIPTGDEKNWQELESDAIADEKRWLLSGIFLACSLFGSFLVGIGVDPLTKFGEDTRSGSSTGKSGLQLLVATFIHMKNPYQLLIIPLTLWSGFEQAFLGADFTAGFITCSWGVGNVGFVLVCYGACNAVCSFLSGSLVQKLGRIPIFTLAGSLNLSLVITMFFWIPERREPVVYFVLAGLWGICDAIWQTQINAFYGFIFAGQEEAAFSNYRLWESIGFIVAYSYQNHLCVSDKQWVLIGVLVTGMAGYYAIEVKETRRKANKSG